tara:strand:+ start:1177 stop:1947 length:771 start_codon:yes stop_codon:yes gene_type:complete
MKSASKNKERILSDIKHFQAMVSNEAAQIKQDINQHIVRRENEETAVEALIDRVSEQLAKLNARMQIVETVLTSELHIQRDVADQMMNTVAVEAPKAKPLELPSLPKQVILNTQSFASNANMGDAELTDTGLSYRWTMSDKVTRFSALVSRAQKMQVKVRLVSAIQDEIKPQIQLLVDGNSVPTRIMFDGTLDCLIADLPKSEGKVDETLLAIQLPNTYSPKELGVSGDERKLGIAINTIEFSEPQKKRRRFFSRR